MHMTRSRRRHGLTLVETIVVIFVFSLLTLTITELLRGGLQAWRRGQVRTQLRSDARYALDQIQADFRQCSVATTGTITPAPGAAKSSTLQFTRYDNVGTGGTKTVTYTINGARQLTRLESPGGELTVVAENVVATDPRDGQQKSYFAWEDSGATPPTTMGIHLYLVQDAASQLTASSPSTMESVWLHSGAYWAGQGPDFASLSRAPVAVNTPASLIDPRTGLSPFVGSVLLK